MKVVFSMAIALAVLSVAAAAQDQDPPTRAGRLGYISGTVSLRPAGDTEWAAAVPNRALTTGDRVWVDSNGRAEVQIGQTRIRLAGGTELDIANLDDNTIQASVTQGTATVSVRHLNDGEAEEIDTPNAAIGIGRAGDYRIDVSPDGSQSTVKVWAGQVAVTAAGSSFDVNAKQAATVNGTDAPTYDVVDIGPEDGWDQWSDDRDHREEASASSRYVSADIAGYDDLDGNGGWRDDPTYGAVWTPTTVVVGWSPYHYGHWVWEGRWGWTWVDDAPWGWAPFHYGRWVYAEDHWGWCPGRVYERPVWAPALVAFVGGRGWNAGVSFGGGVGVGWFPLAPEEAYYPAYHVSNTYIRNVNITNVTNVTNITNVTNVTNITYRNREVAGAVTVVPDNAFRNGQSVSRYAVRVPAGAIQQAPRLGSAAPFVPTRRSIAPIASQHRPPRRDREQPDRRRAGAAATPRGSAVVRRPGEAVGRASRPSGGGVRARDDQAARPSRWLRCGSANQPVRPGVTLKPARPAVATSTAPKPVARPGYVATPVPHPYAVATARTGGRARAWSGDRDTRSTAPAPRPTIFVSAGSASGTSRRSIRSSGTTWRTGTHKKPRIHQQTCKPQALAKQQATEHRTLDNTYVQARSSGAKSMPAPPPRPAAPATIVRQHHRLVPHRSAPRKH